MKKSALATTALAVGAGASTNVAAQQDDENGEGLQEGEVVIHGRDYFPDTDFTVLAEMDSGTRDTLVEALGDEFDDDWDVYVIQANIGSGGPLGHIFVDEDEAQVSEGDTATMSSDTVSYRNPELNLLELDIGAAGGAAGGAEDEEEEENGAGNGGGAGNETEDGAGNGGGADN